MIQGGWFDLEHMYNNLRDNYLDLEKQLQLERLKNNFLSDQLFIEKEDCDSSHNIDIRSLNIKFKELFEILSADNSSRYKDTLTIDQIKKVFLLMIELSYVLETVIRK